MAIRPIKLPLGALNDHDSMSLDEQFCSNLRSVRTLRDRIEDGPGTTLFAGIPTVAGVTSKGSVIGQFESRLVVGSEIYDHLLGDTPVAVIMFASRTVRPTVDTVITVPNASQFIGFSDGTTERSLSYFIQSAVSPTVSKGRYTDKIISAPNGSGGVALEGTITSLTNADFTINWTTIDPAFAWNIYYILIGSCGGLVNAKVKEWVSNAATGNQAVTGIGFRPQVAFHLTSGRTAGGTFSNAKMNVGCMASGQPPNQPGNWAFAAVAQDAQVTSNSFRSQSSQKALLDIGAAGGAATVAGSLVSMDPDGFTVNLSTTTAPGFLIGTLCISGFTNYICSSFNKPTAPPPTQYGIGGIGFNPTAIFNASAFTTGLSPTTEADFKFSFGASTTAKNLAISASETDGMNPDQAVQQNNSAHSIVKLGPVGTTRVSALNLSLYDETVLYNFDQNDTIAEGIGFFAYLTPAVTPSTTVGFPRNYYQAIVGTTPTEKLMLWTVKKLFIWNPGTGQFDIDSGEAFTAEQNHRFGIANTQGIIAWSNGKDNIRQWNGAAYSNLITSGTNHAALMLLAFNNRIISIRPFFTAIDHMTQIRWSMNGNVNNWSGVGSGALEIVETQSAPLTGGFTLGDRCYITRQREILELVATGTLSPVFRVEDRISGVGVLATWSIAQGEDFVFFLGPDDVYRWDGAQLTAVGGNIYHTMLPLINYTTSGGGGDPENTGLNNIKAALNTTDSEYWLLIGQNLFIYDYRRDHWYRDDYSDIRAISSIRVADQVPNLNIGQSQVIMMGHSDGRTFRADNSSNTFLGNPIDKYFETKDYTAEEIKKGFFGGFSVDLWGINSLREIRFQSTPGAVVEMGVSTDRGVTYDREDITVNSLGTGVRFVQIPFAIVRFRFRQNDTNVMDIHGSIATDYEDAGYQFP